MKKLLYIVFIILVDHSCQIKDPSLPKPEDSFIKYFGGNGEQKALDLEIVYNSDSSSINSLVILGTKQETGEDVKGFYIIKTDENGNEINHAFYSSIKLQNQITIIGEASSGQIEPIYTSEGIHEGYMLVANFNFLNLGIGLDSTRTIIYQLDIDLDSIRSKSINDFSMIDTNDDNIPDMRIKNSIVGNDIVRLKDQGYFLVGGIKKAGKSDYDFLELKLDAELNEVWKRDFNNGSLNGTDDFFKRAFEGRNDNLVSFGYSNATVNVGKKSNGINFYCKESNPSNGAVANTIILGSNVGNNEDDVLNHVIKTPVGFTAVGSAIKDTEDKFGIIARYLYRGDLVGDTVNVITSLDSEANSVALTDDGGFVVVGKLLDFFDEDAQERKNDELAFIKLPPSGIFSLTDDSIIKNYGLASGDDEGVDVVSIGNNKLLVLGTADFGGITLITLTKLNYDGSLDN